MIALTRDSPLHPNLTTPKRVEIKRAQAKIHSMSLRMYESKHDTIYTLLKPFIKSQARQVRTSASVRLGPATGNCDDTSCLS